MQAAAFAHTYEPYARTPHRPEGALEPRAANRNTALRRRPAEPLGTLVFDVLKRNEAGGPSVYRRRHMRLIHGGEVARYADQAQASYPYESELIERSLGALGLNGLGRPLVDSSFTRGALLNYAMLPQWRELVRGSVEGAAPSVGSLIASQERLAVLGLLVVQSRRRWMDEANQTTMEYIREKDAPGRTFIEGFLNEVDAGIALTQASIMAAHTERDPWWVLPAPPQFEESACKKNGDFLVLDAVHDRAIAVQVKSNAERARARAHYDPSILLIDGRHDLGNRLIVNDARRREVSYGGFMTGSLYMQRVQLPQQSEHQAVACDRYIFEPSNRGLLQRVASMLHGRIKKAL